MPSGNALGASNRSGCRVWTRTGAIWEPAAAIQGLGEMLAHGNALASTRGLRRRLAGLCFGAHGLGEAVERQLAIVGDEFRDRALVGDAAVPLCLLAIIECARHDEPHRKISGVLYALNNVNRR